MPVDIAAEVIANARLSDDYNVLSLAAPAIAAVAAPGQFVMIKAAGTPGTLGTLGACDPLLRRPFSVFEILRDAEGTAIGFSLLSKRIGISTARMYAAEPGDRFACLGPLGTPFSVVEPPTDAWMVAGGVGLAPFATLAQALQTRRVITTLFYGARRSAELFYVDFFRRLGVELVLTTEDGSAGVRGRIVDPLDGRLERRERAAPVMIYACGPEGMLAATAKVAMRHERPCQVSVERVMGCGMGGCYSCVVPMREEGRGFHHVRSCISGPVLAGDRIVWD
jgi:dihydroorotate dehydrogenase electron transfer subunit